MAMRIMEWRLIGVFSALLVCVPTLNGTVAHGDDVGGRKDITQQGEDARKWNARRIARESCVMRVMVPETSDSRDLPLDVVIENRGARRVEFGESGYFLDCKVTLKTKTGTDIPYKGLGRFVFGGPQDRHQYAFIVLSSRQSRSWKFNLAEAFESLSPGEYFFLTLKATVVFEDKNVRADSPESKKFTDRVELVVEELAFTVVTKEASTR